MKKRFVSAVLLVAVLCLAQAGFAEFYKYKDENGVTRFTDDLAEVPEDQRETAAGYTEPADFQTPDEREGRPAEGEPAEKVDVMEDLLQQQVDINQEFLRLRKEKQDLDKARSQAKSNAEIKEYNAQILEYTRKVKEYEQRQKIWRDAFEAARKQGQTKAGETEPEPEPEFEPEPEEMEEEYEEPNE